MAAGLAGLTHLITDTPAYSHINGAPSDPVVNSAAMLSCDPSCLVPLSGDNNSEGVYACAASCPGTGNGTMGFNGSAEWKVTANPNLQTENPFILEWYLQLVYIIVFVSMVIVAAGGNIIVIWIVVAHKRMRTVTNYFLVNLAVADALISILNTLFNFVYMLYSDWPFGRAYCKFTQFIANCTISASVFTFMAIAIDRYMAIIHPLKHRAGAGIVLAAIALIWIASIGIALPSMLFAETHTWRYASGNTRTVCYMEWPDGSYNTIDFTYSVVLLLVNYFVPMIALSVTYTRVGVELWGSQAIGERTTAQLENARNKRRVVKMMIVIVIVFGVCWLPQHVVFLIMNRHKNINNYEHIQHVYLAVYWLAMSNSMYNPIVYCWMNARFRRGFMYVFRWLPCVHLTPQGTPGRGIVTSVRTSYSEHTKYGGYERNGSVMQTVIESLDEAPSTQTTAMIAHPRPFPTVKEEEDIL